MLFTELGEERLFLQRLVFRKRTLFERLDCCCSWGRDGRKGVGSGWEEGGTCLSTEAERLTFESQSYSFSHLHVKMSDIICECQKYLQKN